MNVSKQITEASKSMLDALELIREWFPKRTVFLDCSVVAYEHACSYLNEDDSEPVVRYKSCIIHAGSGNPTILTEGATLYELLTRLYQKHLDLACHSVVELVPSHPGIKAGELNVFCSGASRSPC